MRRILVIGSPGAGKTTLSRDLAARLGLPLIHLDREYFGPGWGMPSRPEWRARVRDLAARSEWVMEGNYASTFDLRVPRATAIVWLDAPRWKCLFRVSWRVLRHYGRQRPDLGPGCTERFDASFMRWIWTYPERMGMKTRRMLAGLRPDQSVWIIRSPAEADALLRHLTPACEAA